MTSTIRVSYSELKDARQCSMKHDLAWRYGWRKSHKDECYCALCVGIAWHAVLNAYYTGLRGKYIPSHSRVGYNHGIPFGGAYHAARDKLLDQPEHLQERLRWMLEGYAATYGNEPGWTVLATEQELIVPLPQLYDDLKVSLKVIIDLIIKDPSGKVWVDDHKTCTTLPSEAKQVDPQLPLYMYALQQVTAWPNAFGARYSYSRKPYVRKDGTFTDWELDKRFRRRKVAHTSKEIYSVARDAYISIYTRYHEAELFEKPPRSIGPDCSWSCDFESACKASRKGYDITQFLRDQNFTVARPDNPKTPEELERGCQGGEDQADPA